MSGPVHVDHGKNNAEMQGSSRWAWIFVPLSIFGFTRIVGAAFLMIGASRQVALGPGMPGMHVMYPIPASPTYWQVMGNWDAQWYKSIALSGYPGTLPVLDGAVQINEWAFFPLFPFLTRVVMTTGLSFEIAGSLLSLAAAGIGVVVIHRIVQRKAGTWPAMTVTLGICCFPTAPSLQLAYTDGLGLLFLALILWSVERGDYGWLSWWIFCLSLTRGIVIAVAGLLFLLWVLRWWRRWVEPFPTRDRIWLAATMVQAGLLMGLWPLITGLVTGTPQAYLKTQLAWPGNADGLMGNWFVSGVTDGWGMLLAVLVLTSLVLWLGLRVALGGMGTALGLWMVVYSLYVMAATRPVPSIMRYLLLGVGPGWLLPGPLPARGRDRTLTFVVTIVLALAGIVGQYYWIANVYTVAVHPGVQPYP